MVRELFVSASVSLKGRSLVGLWNLLSSSDSRFFLSSNGEESEELLSVSYIVSFSGLRS